MVNSGNRTRAQRKKKEIHFVKRDAGRSNLLQSYEITRLMDSILEIILKGSSQRLKEVLYTRVRKKKSSKSCLC